MEWNGGMEYWNSGMPYFIPSSAMDHKLEASKREEKASESGVSNSDQVDPA